MVKKHRTSFDRAMADKMGKAPTSGFVIDRHSAQWTEVEARGAERLLQLAPSQDFQKTLEMARKQGYRFVICAGRLWKPSEGVFGMVVFTDEAEAIAAAVTVNTTMAERGSTGTVWNVLGDRPFMNAVVEALKE